MTADSSQLFLPQNFGSYVNNYVESTGTPIIIKIETVTNSGADFYEW